MECTLMPEKEGTCEEEQEKVGKGEYSFQISL